MRSNSILLLIALERATAFADVRSSVAGGHNFPSFVHRQLLPHSKRFGSAAALHMVQNATPFGAISYLFSPSKQSAAVTPNGSAPVGQQVVESFIAAINSRSDPATIVKFFSDEVTFVDTSYYNPIVGKENLLKHFHLHAGSSALSTFAKTTSFSAAAIVVDDIVSFISDELSGITKVCVMYHLTDDDGKDVSDTTGITFYNVIDGKISSAFDVTEPSSPKPGDSGLKVLKTVSNLIGDESIVMEADTSYDNDQSVSAVEKYFDAWNARDMKRAVSQFKEDCYVRDLQYDGAFSNRDELERHLLRCKDCLPSSFNFVIDDIAITSQKAGVLWHVENNGEPLSFTRGCSFYTFDRNGLIQTGFDIPEKAPPKTGFLKTVSSKFEAEPIRFIPAVMWVAYMYILFFSDGILPGANALALEQRTWEEVRDLSINFFLVSPLLNLPFSPVVHPMLEGVFNLLLAWAAMFACFLSDERKNKPNLLPFGPMLAGMQFLTSGFLLPYLITRTPEFESQVYLEDIDGELQAKIGEWRPLGGFLASIGTASIIWAFIGRPEFGEFQERYDSFIDLLSIDRVGSSFIVDLVIFALFQSWFVDDDLQRRGVATSSSQLMGLRNAAKYVPFFGLAAYITLRPDLPSRNSAEIISCAE
jgi:ketosteroid isomerase-like protein